MTDKMKNKIQKLIDENLNQEEIFNDNEEDFTVGSSVNDILTDKIEEFPNFGCGLLAFRNKVFRSENNAEDFFDSPSEEDVSNDESYASDISSISEQISNGGSAELEESDIEDDKGPPQEINSKELKQVKLHFLNKDHTSDHESDESDKPMQTDESEVEDDFDSVDNTKADVVDDLSGVFSKKILDDSLELRKGTAVTNQLNLWDNLIESRILLQKCIAETNNLSLEEFSSSQCSAAKSNAIKWLEECQRKWVDLQEKLRRETTKQDKIREEEYATFRNKSIENWYNRTKGARLNFSAFETPLQKQIENNRVDLIQKTYLKSAEPHENIDGTDSPSSSTQINTETINDDDFYHKLLRHYIRRKTANISDSAQLGRHWIKLQNLRNKMKRKIDTRRTKGRKLKYDPHNKLINFMAIQNLHRWEDESINELFSSVFGKKILKS